MRKYTDTGDDVSEGGRLKRYWEGRRGKIANSRKADIVQYSATIDLVQLCKEYQLKGIEFGRWVPQSERDDYVNALRQSLYDLSVIMHTKNIGMFDQLGVAFGARGNGGMAAAHYEPRLNMINLTRTSGASCLAHEYGHAIDFIIGGYADKNPKYRALTGGSALAKINDNSGGRIRTVANAIVDYVRTTQSYRDLENRAPKKMGYFGQSTEIFARWFEEYCCMKHKNLFLTKSKEVYMPEGQRNLIYLTGEEMKPTLPLGSLLCTWIGQGLSSNNFSLKFTPDDCKLVAAFRDKYLNKLNL